MSDNNKEDIRPGTSNNSEEKIKPVDINNNKKDIRLADIKEQLSATLNWIHWNILLTKSFLTFREITFSESEFLDGTLVLDTRHKYLRS